MSLSPMPSGWVGPGSSPSATSVNSAAALRTKGHDKQAKLRAVLRADEVVQDLYRAGLIKQTTAAKLS